MKMWEKAAVLWYYRASAREAGSHRLQPLGTATRAAPADFLHQHTPAAWLPTENERYSGGSPARLLPPLRTVLALRFASAPPHLKSAWG